MSGPMGPERLDSIRFLLEDDEYHVPLDKRLAVQLLAHADHWEAEAKLARAGWDEARAEAKRLASKWVGAVTDSDSNAVIAQDTDNENARLRAEVQRYRSRCPVTAEDVEAAGVTAGLAESILVLHGWRCYQVADSISRWDNDGMNTCTIYHDGTDVSFGIAAACSAMAGLLGRPAFDILDEMAAIDTGAEVDQ